MCKRPPYLRFFTLCISFILTLSACGIAALNTTDKQQNSKSAPSHLTVGEGFINPLGYGAINLL